MFKRVLIGVVMAALLGAGGAGATPKLETRRVSVTWKDGQARVDGVGVARLTVAEDGDRVLSFTFDKGPYCSAIGSKAELLELNCGRREGRFYTVSHTPGRTPEVELVTVGG